MTGLPPALAELASAFHVSTEFHDWQGHHREVDPETIRAVLTALGVDASDPAAALEEQQLAPWRRVVPPCTVVRQGTRAEIPVHVPHGSPATVSVELESGGRVELEQVERWVEPRTVDGVQTGEATFRLPEDLPLGYHQLVAGGGAQGDGLLIVTPRRLELPEPGTRAWGFATQLYSSRSGASWGLGDLRDLATLARWAGEQGADYVLVNPLHAAEPVEPMEPSPYLPSTRRFVNPVYLRVEDVPELVALGEEDRARVAALGEEQRAASRTPDPIDRDSVWAAKREALGLLHAVARDERREAAYHAFLAREGGGLVDFATWCALLEERRASWQEWPEELRDPRSPAVEEARARLADRVDFFSWLQWLLDEQMTAAQQAATDAGMRLGIMHDLAVGVHPSSADAWALQSALAQGVSVGAPPDAYNQQGQDWSQPPWRPDVLVETGYAAYRAMLRTILRHSGGIRVDHILGLFRLWWVPQGQPPTEGTYVRYDPEALVGILCLEAARAGAVVVGEDLGTVEPGVREFLSDRGVLGTSILWFERDWDAGVPLPPERWRELSLASVTTHDLPPTAGYLAGEHIRIRDELGLLTRPVEEERAADAADQRSWVEFLLQHGFLRPEDEHDEQAVVEALHRLVCASPARLVSVALPDAVGDRRAVNQPGTFREYPNWRFPLCDGSGRPVLLEELVSDARAESLARVVRDSLARAAADRG
ncbi:4-alpha-glucanotransferase [Motilibacter rhizosphaerae]|uniref:4-alpha-glucanotransferase n=1 Tax=Motilibacter rhizosphaerae TaxID=598652 RepID=A0A4Q7NRW1_9ACTN|nr:4-alpha-glucanotransferase [Motilibacter rhizosphaerae]RZS89817.1 4-alpha-glucanotransferase [Motilibacter rhizosphaerae]